MARLTGLATIYEQVKEGAYLTLEGIRGDKGDKGEDGGNRGV